MAVVRLPTHSPTVVSFALKFVATGSSYIPAHLGQICSGSHNIEVKNSRRTVTHNYTWLDSDRTHSITSRDMSACPACCAHFMFFRFTVKILNSNSAPNQ